MRARGLRRDAGRVHWLTAVLGLVLAVAVTSAVSPEFAPGLFSSERPDDAPKFGVARPRVETATVVRRLPHDPEAFTQGLVFDRGALYESTGLYGRSELRRVDLSSGKVLQRRRLDDDDFGEGLTAHDGRLIQLTWKSGTGYVYDRDSFRLLRRFRYETEGWGLTTDGHHLIMSDGSAVLSFLDPATFAVRRRVMVTAGGRPVERLNELEYVHGAVYANVWQTTRIARIDPATGRVDLWWDVAGIGEPARGVANGIAYDDATGRMYLTGKNWTALYEVRLPR